ncbi:MAG: hypothetical protein WBA93_24550 [Microcoleaceae cyanobacterium]
MSNSDIALLKQMINPTATVPLEENYQKKLVTLIEPSDNYEITIYGMPDDDEVIIIKVDAFGAPTAIFQGNRGECKRADFVIIADTDKKKVILFIEMKGRKKTSKEKEIIQQLKGAQCFVAYCREIGQLFWQQENFLSGYKYRFVSIKDIKIPKKKTRFDCKTDCHDRPENMLKISSPRNLQFNYLIGGKK